MRLLGSILSLLLVAVAVLLVAVGVDLFTGLVCRHDASLCGGRKYLVHAKNVQLLEPRKMTAAVLATPESYPEPERTLCFRG